MQAILGQRLSSDINLVAQLLILAGLWVGFFFARSKQIRRHQRMQTSMVLANTFFIVFVMFTSFYNYVIAGGTVTGTIANLMMVHGLVGLAAELTGIYLILRMSTHILPEWLCVRNFKLVMRSLLGLWTVLVGLGLGIYYYRYLAPKPVAAENPLVPLAYTVDDVQIHADEMAEAVGRGELATARRHAEHLINLIVGKQSLDYGDIDENGSVEDPGNGTGAVVYLARVRQLAGASSAGAILDQINGTLVGMVGDAKAVLQAQEPGQVTGQVQQASDRAAQLRGSPDSMLNQLAQALGVPVTGLQNAAPNVATGPTSSAPQTVTVVMQNFVYTPQTLKVKQGTTIVFVNRDVAKHTVTSDTGAFESGDIDSGQSYTLKLDQPGVYSYFCAFHGDKGGVDMAGTIEVTP